MINLAPQIYWDERYAQHHMHTVADSHPCAQLIRTYIGPGTGDCIEIGCFPGGFLAYFGDLGYQLHGIDLTPRVADDLPQWLESKGYGLGTFIQGDFFEWKPVQLYDVVSSFGFVEHFTNFEDVIIRHAQLVAPNGALIITAPNFRGRVQHALHSFFDKPNVSRHNLDAMDPQRWAAVLRKENFEIIFCGWFGGFDFWVDSRPPGPLARLCLPIVLLTAKLFSGILWSNKNWAPYCGVVARRIR